MAYNAPTNTYDTFADLRLAVGQASSSVTVLGKDNPYDSFGGTFLWNPTFNYPDDNFTIIQPLNIAAGRWIRMTHGDMLSGRIVFSADGSETVFTHTFESELLNNDYIIIFQPLTISGESGGIGSFVPYTFTKSTTGVTMTFVTAPFPGSLQFDYIIRYTPNILEL